MTNKTTGKLELAELWSAAVEHLAITPNILIVLRAGMMMTVKSTVLTTYNEKFWKKK